MSFNQRNPQDGEPEADPAGAAGAEALHLELVVEDPEVAAALRAFADPDEQSAFALRCLRIGVLAIRHAGTTIDAQRLRSEGDRLVAQVQSRLESHAAALNQRLESELRRYFDPKSGQFEGRVRALVAEDGELAGVLRAHMGGDSSVLARQLAQAVGEHSPLMQYLTPSNKDGLIHTLTTTIQTRLDEDRAKVLGEFDLNNADGALRRMVSDIQQNFDPDEPRSVTARLERALEHTRTQLRKDMSLDDESSAFSNLHRQLREQLDHHAAGQRRFQAEIAEAIGELRGERREREKGTRGGLDFEAAVADAISAQVEGYGDLFERVGERVGLVSRSKVGDHVQTLGPESAGPGRKIVYECKRDKSYSLTEALAELAEARKNRAATVGVFVVAESRISESKRMSEDFARKLSRHGDDIIVVWDETDPTTDIYLEVGVSLARALVVRDDSAAGPSLATDWDDIDRQLNEIGKQADTIDEITRWCENIGRDADKIHDRGERMQKHLRRIAKKLADELDSLRR